jgi:homoserine kinase
LYLDSGQESVSNPLLPQTRKQFSIMRKVKITLPATVTNLGPGVHTLGLALGLYATVEITERADETLIVEPEGEGAGRYSIGLQHPVVLALMRVFQRLERAPLGLTVKITNQIPLVSGLGAEAAFQVAGIISANNLLGNTLSRAEVLEMAALLSRRPDHTVTAILGGLTASFVNSDKLIYRTFPVSAPKVVVVLPVIENYPGYTVTPERVSFDDSIHNLNRIPLLVEALSNGDLAEMGQLMDDKLLTPSLRPHISGYDHVVEIARRAGAEALTISGSGPAIVAFATAGHKKLAEAMEAAFENAGVKARSWIVPIDTQGVVVSIAQSA